MKDKINSILSEVKTKISEAANENELQNVKNAYVGKQGALSMLMKEMPKLDAALRPEMGKVLRALMPKTYILVPGYGAQGGKGKDLVHFFNQDGLGAIVNSSRGIIAAYKNETYAQFGSEHYADASRQAVLDMKEDLKQAVQK